MINKTSNYAMFKKFQANRELVPVNLRKITNSILHKNLLQWRPILVNQKMEVLDGQHRLEVAKELGLEIYYQIQQDSDDVDIILLNNNQKAWGLEDYRNYHENRGNIEYMKLRKFCERNNISVAMAVDLLTGTRGANHKSTFKDGKFMFPDDEVISRKQLVLHKIQEVIAHIDRLKLTDKKFLQNKGFHRALMVFMVHPDLDFDIFKGKIEKQTNLIRTLADWKDYVVLFTEIYNWKNHNPLT